MTSPINFGGGVGTQPVIQNPSIGESFAPLLQALQQQQALQQRNQALQQAAAQAEQEQQFKALKLLADKSNDLAFLDSEAGRELAGMAGAPETVDTLLAGAKDQANQQLAQLEELALATFPGVEDAASAQKFLLVLKHDLNPEVDAGTISQMMGEIFGPTDLELAQTALAEERARVLRNEIEAEAKGAKNEELKEAANRRTAELLGVEYIPGVDYIEAYQKTLGKDPSTMVATFARTIMERQTLMSRLNGTRPNSIASSVQQAIVITEEITGKPFDVSLTGPLGMELSMEASADEMVAEIRETRGKGRGAVLEFHLPMTNEAGEQLPDSVISFNDPKSFLNDGPANNLVIEELKKRYPTVDEGKIKAAVRRSFKDTAPVP